MGLLLRGIRWIWNRIGDAYTVADLADLFDLKTAGIAILGFLGMLIFGSANYEWSPQTILLAALIAGACVAIIVIALRFVVGAFHAPASTAKKNQKNQSRRELAARLDREFFSEGVRERNRVKMGSQLLMLPNISRRESNLRNGAILSNQFWTKASILLLKNSRISERCTTSNPIIGYPNWGHIRPI